MNPIISYLKEHIKWMILYVICIALMSAILIFNQIPAEEIGYGIFICGFCLLGLFVTDGFFYVKKYKQLAQLKQHTEVLIESLDTPQTMVENQYQELLRIMSEEKTRQQNEMTGRAKEQKEYYTMWVHQIKTPIAAMRLLLQEKSGEVDTAEEQDELFRIEQYVEMALQYMRLDSESTDFLIKKVDIDTVIKEVVHKYARLFIRKKVKLQYNEIHTEVLTDEKWLAFVIEQLLSNAIKYSPGGNISIYMPTEHELVIEDNGIGISPEDLPRVCEKGYTGYNGHVDKRSTGIGLYLCNRITKKLCHGLRMESEVGKGTKVYVSFPTEHEII